MPLCDFANQSISAVSLFSFPLSPVFVAAFDLRAVSKSFYWLCTNHNDTWFFSSWKLFALLHTELTKLSAKRKIRLPEAGSYKTVIWPNFGFSLSLSLSLYSFVTIGFIISWIFIWNQIRSFLVKNRTEWATLGFTHSMWVRQWIGPTATRNIANGNGISQTTCSVCRILAFDLSNWISSLCTFEAPGSCEGEECIHVHDASKFGFLFISKLSVNRHCLWPTTFALSVFCVRSETCIIWLLDFVRMTTHIIEIH